MLRPCHDEVYVHIPRAGLLFREALSKAEQNLGKLVTNVFSISEIYIPYCLMMTHLGNFFMYVQIIHFALSGTNCQKGIIKDSEK